MLNAFSKVGSVNYEADFGGRRKPDLHFISDKDLNQFFAADITAISNKGFEGHNPYDALENALMEKVRERGLRPNSFSLNIEGNYLQLYRGGPKVKLQLPGSAKFEEKIFNENNALLEDRVLRRPSNHPIALRRDAIKKAASIA